uniref:Uncharacterized protein n=1 Tax=Manihot esculenta TaxID=3983 RepID=A0A2C9U6G4_MANES
MPKGLTNLLKSKRLSAHLLDLARATELGRQRDQAIIPIARTKAKERRKSNCQKI